MALVAVSEWKTAECDDCGSVFQVVKWIPLKHACCKTCGSLKIRRYYTPEERRMRAIRRRNQPPTTTNHQQPAGGEGEMAIECRLCSKGPNEIRGYLHRVNELGVTGIWECRPSCDADMSAGQRIIAAIEGEETNAEHTSNRNVDNERPA